MKSICLATLESEMSPWLTSPRSATREIKTHHKCLPSTYVVHQRFQIKHVNVLSSQKITFFKEFVTHNFECCDLLFRNHTFTQLPFFQEMEVYCLSRARSQSLISCVVNIVLTFLIMREHWWADVQKERFHRSRPESPRVGITGWWNTGNIIMTPYCNMNILEWYG